MFLAHRNHKVPIRLLVQVWVSAGDMNHLMVCQSLILVSENTPLAKMLMNGPKITAPDWRCFNGVLLDQVKVDNIESTLRIKSALNA